MARYSVSLRDRSGQFVDLGRLVQLSPRDADAVRRASSDDIRFWAFDARNQQKAKASLLASAQHLDHDFSEADVEMDTDSNGDPFLCVPARSGGDDDEDKMLAHLSNV